MFRALKVRNFKLYFFGSLVGSFGAWMQATAMVWVVLTELTDGNASAMGVTAALQFLPALLLIPIVARLVDRFDRRTILLVTNLVLSALATTTGILLVLGALTLPMMFGFALIWGVVVAFDQPVRHAFFGDLVEGDALANAVSLGSVQFNVARLAGPAAAGALIALIGSGWLFIFNAAAFLVQLVMLLLLRRSELEVRSKDEASGRFRVALRYVRRRPDLLLLLVIAFLTSAFAAQFPIYGAAVAVGFHQPSWAFGLLASCYAVGSLTGAVLMARVRVARMRDIVAYAFLVAAVTAVSGLMPSFWAYGAVAVGCGYAIVTLMATANIYVQTHTDALVRGRVLVLHNASMVGGAPFGAPIIGIAADAWGAQGAVLLVAAVAFVAAALGLLWFVSTGRVHRAEGVRFGVSVDATRPITLPGEG